MCQSTTPIHQSRWFVKRIEQNNLLAGGLWNISRKWPPSFLGWLLYSRNEFHALSVSRRRRWRSRPSRWFKVTFCRLVCWLGGPMQSAEQVESLKINFWLIFLFFSFIARKSWETLSIMIKQMDTSKNKKYYKAQNYSSEHEQVLEQKFWRENVAIVHAWFGLYWTTQFCFITRMCLHFFPYHFYSFKEICVFSCQAFFSTLPKNPKNSTFRHKTT